ncbi:MAG TPA: hypothetical protein VJZ00_16435 [Thermoanaerobaculia bacterium]|nr:hypothetical protein [Thermoanaerobaculia bacterium]
MRAELCALLLFASVLSAETVRPGDVVVVHTIGGTTTIAGADVDSIANARRTSAHRIEVAGAAMIRVPRTATIESVSSERAIVNVSDVAALRVDATNGSVVADRIRGNIDGKTITANLTARDVGGNVIVSTGNGNITAQRVRGLVDVTSGNGNTIVSQVGGGVHVTTINGKTGVACVAGAVTIKDTSGQVHLSSVSGDVDAFTALGKIEYAGALRADRSYRLRTLDGALTLEYAPDGAGFIAELASDAGQIETEPPLRTRRKRAQVRAGDERARVVLDAVGGRVTLLPLDEAVPRCP